MLVMLSAFTSASQAITISADKPENLGNFPEGSALTINLKASDYKAQNPAKIRWTKKVTGRNPGFDFETRRGDNVKFSASSLVKPSISTTAFKITITAHDTDGSEGSITFKGNVMIVPAIYTEEIAEVQAGSTRNYRQRFELSQGSEPLSWEISGDLPQGINFTTETNSNGKVFHILTGKTDEAGEFPFTLKVSNAVGSAEKDYVITTGTSGARIRLPKNFAKSYTAFNNHEFSLDLSSLN